MRALHVLIPIAALIALAGIAAAQNNPCPDCHPDKEGNWTNPFHEVDVGYVETNESGSTTKEVLADTDVAHASPGEEKGFWAYLSICLSAFVDDVEQMLGIHTDIDAHADVYAESNGVDVDAGLTGTQVICDELEVDTSCDWDFDQSQLGDLDGKTWQTVSKVETVTGEDVFVPAVVPDTGYTSTVVCLNGELTIC